MCRRLFKFSGKKPSEVGVAQRKEKSIQGNTPQGALTVRQESDRIVRICLPLCRPWTSLKFDLSGNLIY
jgi:hypothetical protein